LAQALRSPLAKGNDGGQRNSTAGSQRLKILAASLIDGAKDLEDQLNILRRG
jgi:hypothetical protein